MVSKSSSSPSEKGTKRLPRRRAKRARIGEGSCSAAEWRDWGSLACGPAMLIADRVLAADVADYVRFRAACSAWRRCTADPHNDAMDRRFHPRRWTMLPDVLCGGAWRPRYYHSEFQNVDTHEVIRMTIRGLNGRNGRTYLARTPQGLVVLLNKETYGVRVVNPITGAHADLPTVTMLLNSYSQDLVFPRWTEVSFSAELTDDSAVMINFCDLRLWGVARPGDESWTKVKPETSYADGV